MSHLKSPRLSFGPPNNQDLGEGRNSRFYIENLEHSNNTFLQDLRVETITFSVYRNPYSLEIQNEERDSMTGEGLGPGC